MTEHKIEFDAGEVIRPEFNPENDLVAIYVSDDGLESLREAVSPAQPSGSSGDEPDAAPVSDASPLAGEAPLDSAVLDIGMAVIELNAYIPPEMRER
jgi:hypothetical protein